MASQVKAVIKFFLLICIFTPSVAYGDGPLRQRLRENIKDRMIERLENQPAPQTTASVMDRIVKPGDYYFSIPHGGLTRFYRVHVPPSYTPSRPTPLLFAFHGGGGDMNYMADNSHYGLLTKSDQTGYILVFPNGYSNFQSGKLATWNGGDCCGGARDKNIDDTGFVRKIIDNLNRQMNIDRGRIYAIGMSNGGMMSYRLACEMADTFRAIASVTGTDNMPVCNPSRPISILHIHALDDTHVLFNGGAGEDAFRDISKVTDFTSVPETISRWQKRNSCTSASARRERILNVDGAFCDLLGPCSGGTRVQLCVTDTGGHSWPGGAAIRDKTPSRAISANDEIWKFFEGLDGAR